MRPLLDEPLTGGRPVTAMPPSEESPQPVPEHPGWLYWFGVGGLIYAKHPNDIHPPVVVRDVNWTKLLGRIRDAEAFRRSQRGDRDG
jgi:hypothetical protein